MTVIERFNLLWLSKAMTAPVSYGAEHYYYDAKGKTLFHTIIAPNNGFRVIILNTLDVKQGIEIESDLAVRLEFANEDGSDIVEIPRLSVDEKINIQLRFLSVIPDSFDCKKLLPAIWSQKDAFRFIFDDVLNKNSETYLLAEKWEDYKVRVVYNSLIQFINSVGIDLNKML